jgi:hypothetical protein
MTKDTSAGSFPSSAVGEFSASGTDPVVADLNALSFSETARTPYGGNTDATQASFPTSNSSKKS